MTIAPHPRHEARRLIALAWPVALTTLNWTLLQIIDIVVVAQAGSHQVAGFGASRTLTFIALMVAIGMMSGILVNAARADGAGDAAGTGAVFWQGLVLAAAIGLVGFAVLATLARPLLGIIGVADGILDVAADVVWITAFAFPAQMVMIATSNWLEGVSHPRRVMVVNLAALPANALLAWALAGGHFGLPMLGARGAALATAVVIYLSAAVMIVAARALPDAHARGIRVPALAALADARSGARALARFGAVPGLASGLELAGFSILIALSTQLGDTATHAFTIVFSLHNLSFGIAIGLGSAAGVRVGNAVGEQRLDTVRPRTLIAAGLALVIVGGFGTAYYLASGAIVALFPAPPPVTALASVLLMVWAPFIVFDGLQVVFLFALRSLGDQAVAGSIAIFAFFVVTGVTGWALIAAGVGASGLSWASGSGMVVCAVLMAARFAWVTSRVRR